VSSVLCYLSLSCAASTIATASLSDFFNALTAWILGAVQWLLSTVVAVLNATSDPGTIVTAAKPEFATLVRLSPLLMVLGLLVATLQALRHGDQLALWRTYLGVAPACVAAIYLAQPLGLMLLEIVNQLAFAAEGSTAVHVGDVATALTHLGVVPSFGVFLLSIFVVFGALLLWIELVLRTVLLTFLLVLVPLVVPLSLFPSLRRVGWRLGETFIAIAGSKVVVMIALALGFSEVTQANATSVLVGVVTLLLACATPFLVLRLVPIMEHSALHAFDGLRRRTVGAVMNAPRSPAGMAVSALLPSAPLPGPPEVPEDLGIPMREGIGDLPLPPLDAEALPPPIGKPTVRHGHVAYLEDEWGPVIGWHWDD